jgi:hypothetical protein
MFGLALRTYLRKIQRLGEGSTEQGRSLWQAVLDRLEQGDVMTRSEVLAHFHRDDGELVVGVLRDLSESGLVFRSGAGPGTSYRIATSEELAKANSAGATSGFDELLWALIYREGPLSTSALQKFTRGADVEAALTRLAEAGRIQLSTDAGETAYTAERLFVPAHAAAGWEAAVFDHFQAMVKTIAARLTREQEGAGAEQVGGSTYSFDVWPGHPCQGEALSHLKRFREQTSNLRAKVRQYNEKHARPSDYATITVYGGQLVVHHHGDDNDDI